MTSLATRTKSFASNVKDKITFTRGDDGSSYKNVAFEVKNTTASLPHIVERLAAQDAEAEALHAEQSAPVQLESCLSPNEKVLAQIPCVGFDGFPDWGLSERQQRVGHWSSCALTQ